jgi:hypothetical protein
VNALKHLIPGMALVAGLALPSGAMARHGADDTSRSSDEQTQVANPAPGDDHGQETKDNQDAQREGGSHRAADSLGDSAQSRTKVFELRGSAVSVDPSASTVVVQVKKANHGSRGRALVGQQITVDLSAARLQVADANGDGTRDINDVSAGDSVEVRLRLATSPAPDLSQPVAASRFKDRSARRPHDPPNHA